MSQENVVMVRRMWEAFLRQDFEDALSAFAPDVEWDGTNLPYVRVVGLRGSLATPCRPGGARFAWKGAALR